MRGRRTLVTAVLAVAGLIGPAASVGAHPVSYDWFHDGGSRSFRCAAEPNDEVYPVSNDVWLKHRAYRQAAWGKVVYTNTNTFGTYTHEFALRGSRHRVSDNGDGTVTLRVLGYGTSRYYDSGGFLVRTEEQWYRFAYAVDLNGTPADPTDDDEVDGSFRFVRTAEARSQFCSDLELFSS